MIPADPLPVLFDVVVDDDARPDRIAFLVALKKSSSDLFVNQPPSIPWYITLARYRWIELRSACHSRVIRATSQIQFPRCVPVIVSPSKLNVAAAIVCSVQFLYLLLRMSLPLPLPISSTGYIFLPVSMVN